MPFTETSPLARAVVSAVIVDVDGVKLTSSGDGHLPVLRVEVTLEVDRPGSFVIETADLDAESFEWIDGGSVAEGKPVTISMGWGDDIAAVMTGEITGLELDVAASEAPRVTIRGFDRLHRLTRGRKTVAYAEVKDSEIAAKIASANGLTAAVQATKEKHAYVLQAEETDLAFLSARARANGYVLLVDGTTLSFKPRPLADAADFTVDAKSDLLELSVRTSILGQVGTHAVRGWSAAEQAPLVAEAKASAAAKMGGKKTGGELADERIGAVVGQVTGLPITSQAQADAAAAAEAEAEALRHVSCEVTVSGVNTLRQGTIAAIRGYGDRFSGSYYLDRVSHTFADGTYTTSLSGKRSAT
ncbi:MAG: contractile injection system protein, VgrG/Pvc8 family [Nannocystaceae bacterium]